MSNNIDITLAGDSKGAQQAIDQLTAKNEKLAQQLERLQDKSKKATDQNAQGMDRASSATLKAAESVVGMTARYVGLGAAINSAFQELQKLNSLQEQARQANLVPAEAIREAKINFVPDQTMNKAQFEQEIFKLASESRVPVQDIATAASDLLSAKGDLTAREGFDQLRQAFRITPNVESAKELAAASADLAKATKVKDPRQTMGFILNQQAASRTTDLKMLAQNINPGVAALISQGFTPEQAAELGATLGQLSFDATGSQTGTGLVSIGKQLGEQRKFVPQRATKGKFKGQFVGDDPRGEFAIPEEQVNAFESATAPERMKVLQRSAELRRAFIATLDLEAKIRQPFIDILESKPGAMSINRSAAGTIQALGENQAQRFEETVGFLDSGPSAQLAGTERRGQSRREQLALKNTRGGRMAGAREEVKKAIQSTDLSGIDTVEEKRIMGELKLKEMNLSPDAAPESAAIMVLKTESNREALNKNAPAFEALRGAQRDIESQREKFAAEAKAMEENNLLLKRQTEVLENIDRKIGGNGNAPRQTERPESRLSRAER